MPPTNGYIPFAYDTNLVNNKWVLTDNIFDNKGICLPYAIQQGMTVYLRLSVEFMMLYEDEPDEVRRLVIESVRASTMARFNDLANILSSFPPGFVLASMLIYSESEVTVNVQEFRSRLQA